MPTRSVILIWVHVFVQLVTHNLDNLVSLIVVGVYDVSFSHTNVFV